MVQVATPHSYGGACMVEFPALRAIPAPALSGSGHGSFRLHLMDVAARGLSVEDVLASLTSRYRELDGRDPDWPYPGRATVAAEGTTITITMDSDLYIGDAEGLLRDVLSDLQESIGPFDVRLETYTEEFYGPLRSVAAGLTLREGLVERDDHGRAVHQRWGVPVDETRAVITAIDSVLLDEEPRRTRIVQSACALDTPVPIAVDRVPHLAGTSLTTELRSESDSTSVRLQFAGAGHMVVSRRDRTTTAVADAMALTAMIESLAGSLDYAMVRDHGPYGGYDMFVSHPKMPPTPPAGRWIPHARATEGERVLDAYGIQLLTDTHLDRAQDLSRWSVKEVAPGRHLVMADDLHEWYRDDLDVDIGTTAAVTHTPVSEKTIRRARQDFGAMIITDEEQMAAFRAWRAQGASGA